MQILEGAIRAGKIMMPWGWGPPGWQREEVILPDGGAPKVAVLQLHLESSMKQEAAPKFLLEVGARGKGCLTKDGWMPCVGGGPGAHQLQPPPSGGQCGPQEPRVGYQSLVVGRACINSVLGKGRGGVEEAAIWPWCPCFS